MQQHPLQKAAEARQQAAMAQSRALEQPVYNPEVGVDGERAQSNTVALGISQGVDLSGKRAARRSSGQALVAQANIDRALQALATQALQALLALQHEARSIELTRQRSSLLQRVADIADQQYRAGDIGVLDRDLAALAQVEALAQQGAAELSLLKAQQQLDSVTLRPELTAPAWPAQLPEPVTSTDYTALAERSLAVRLAMAERDVATAEIATTRAQNRADPTIGLRIGQERERGGSSAKLIGLQFSMPLNVRNDFAAQTDAARAQASAASSSAEAIYQQTLARLRASAVQYQRSHAAWQRWDALASSRLDGSIPLLERVWQLREISTADYLLQLRQLLDGRAAGEALRAQAWQAWLEWLDASGQWQSWLNALNNPNQ
jgi:outer membrane protein, heavy metal efflux system